MIFTTVFKPEHRENLLIVGQKPFRVKYLVMLQGDSV